MTALPEPLLVMIACAFVCVGGALLIQLTAAPPEEEPIPDEPEPAEDARALLQAISRRRESRGLRPIDVEADLADLYLGDDQLVDVGDERLE